MGIKVLCIILVSVCLTSVANAAAPAFDNAADPAYNSGWPQSSNGGFGFSAWGWTNTAGAGVFVGDSSGNGNAPSGNINTNGRAWGMFSGASGQVFSSRNFTAGGPNGSNVLAPGQVFSIQMDNGFVDSSTNGQIGFTLLNTLGNNVFQFGLYGGNNIYTFNAFNGLGTEYTSIPFTDGGMTVSFLLGQSDNFTLTVSENGGGTYVVNSNITGPNNGNISAVQLFNLQAGSGPSHDLFFNSISISTVPEPGIGVLLGLGCFALVMAVRCRSRSANLRRTL
jgi:hypothetical protein